MEKSHYYKKFKYTQNKDRIIFTKYIDKNKLFNAIGDIRWNTFVFNGMVSFKKWNEDEDRSIFTDVAVTAKSPKIPTKIFGGSVYELLNIKYPSHDLYDYMDLTGDIDVQIATPQLITANGSSKDITDYEISHVDNTERINSLTMSYLIWLSNEFSIQIRNQNLFNTNNNLLQFSPNPDLLHVVDVYNNNTVYILVIRENNMIKVQLDIKFKGMEKCDHAVEFVLIEPSSEETFSENYNIFKYGTTNIHMKGHSFLIEDMPSLIHGNIDSMINRISLLQHKEAKYKFFNHIARLQYLNTIFVKFMLLHSPSIIHSERFINKMLQQIIELIQFIKTQDACNFLYLNESCNKQNTYKVIRSITSIFIKYVKKYVKNNKHSMYIKLYPSDKKPIQIKTLSFINEFIHLNRSTLKVYTLTRPKSAPSNTRSKKTLIRKPKSSNSRSNKPKSSNSRSNKK